MTSSKNQGQPNKAKPKKSRTALKVAGGVLVGAAAGAIAGVLFAPDSGKNTRKKLAEKSKKIASDVKATVSKTIKGATDRFKKGPEAKKK